MVLACNQLSFSQCGSVQIQTYTLELNQEEVTALVHHRQQVWAVDEPLPHEQSIRAEVGPLQSAGLCRV